MSPGTGNRLISLQNLANLLPDLLNTILHLYNRAANISGEPVPHLVYSETVIRLSRLLVAVFTRDGSLDDNALRSIVVDAPLVPLYNPERPRGTVSLRKSDIVNFLFRGLPLPLASSLPATDLVPIVAGVASVLSALDLPRKKAFVLRGLLSTMVPTLVQARKIGAAEVGIHPAAGLASLSDTVFDINALDAGSGNMEESLRFVLAAIAEIYGAQGAEFRNWWRRKRPASNDNTKYEPYDSISAIIDRASRQYVLDEYGDLYLKVDVLKTCINCCEALPDFEGVLLFTVELLRTIRGDLMLIAGSHQAAPILSRDEQVRLLNNIKRTVGASRRLGLSDLSADYWDDFLVRGVQLLPVPDSKRPVRQTKATSAAGTNDKAAKDPFLYNPFARSSNNKSVESLMVAGEDALFQVTLQNPFEFDLEVESLRLHSDGVSIDARADEFVIAPLSVQDVIMSGVANEEGVLNITECIVKIRCCRERRFPIFAVPWKPEADQKYKRTGLYAKQTLPDRPLSWSSSGLGGGKVFSKKGAETSPCEVKVIKSQPSLAISRMSLSQSAVMVLEGEVRPFTITLHNTSVFNVDFIHFTFHDSTTKQLEAALNNRDLLPAEVYELQLKLSTNPALKWRPDESAHSTSIPAGKSATFTIEVFGKPGLQDATVQIDYSSIGSTLDKEIPDTFYTRQLFVPLTVTVNASIEVARCDIVPFSGDFAWWKCLDAGELEDGGMGEETRPPVAERRRFPLILSHLKKEPVRRDHCILILDIRNAWPSPISVLLGVSGQPIVTSADQQAPPRQVGDDEYTVDGELQPGQLSRFVLALPRIHLDNPHAAIPPLSTAFRRQFVVSTNKQTFEAEAASREAFWYREELLKRIYGTWKEMPIGRRGTIDMRSIRMSPRMVDAIQLEDVDISYSLTTLPPSHTETDCEIVTQTGRSKYTVKTDQLLRLVVNVRNRSSTPIHPLLRLQPSLRNQPSNVALDLPRRLAWTGMLQKALPILHQGQSAEATLGVTILCRGEYEFGASVEEVRLLESPSTAGHAGPQTQAGATSNAEGLGIVDSFGAGMAKRRRIWHARESCIVNAHE